MQAWHWLLLTALATAVVLCWRVSRELRHARLRVATLTRRVKRLRRLIILDRLDHLERDIHEIEDLIIRRKTRAHDADEDGAGITSVVATCRSYVRRSAEEGRSPDHADAVVRVVLDHLVRDNPARYARLGQILSRAERDRWLRERKATGRA